MKTVKNNSAMAELRDAAVRSAAAGELLTGFLYQLCAEKNA
jgi:hypothetical protein